MRDRHLVVVIVVVIVLLTVSIVQAGAQTGAEPSAPHSNTAPMLSWTGEPDYVADGLDPESGSQVTSFVFRVLYSDAEGDAPNFVRLRVLKGSVDIAGSPFEMSYASGDPVSGATYTHSLSGLAAGSDYTYYFEAQDANGADAPATTALDAPTVTSDTFWQYLALVMRNYEPNVPPYVPRSPSPADGATDVWITSGLTWVGGDPNSAPVVTYDVYFAAGDSTPDTLLCNDVSTTYCDPPGMLAHSTTYYWQVVATDEFDASTTGPVWRFTSSAPNNPPNTPSNPSPADAATEQPVGVDLGWTGGDPDPDAVTYDVYLETSNPPTALVCDDTPSPSCDPGSLQYEQTYYWQVVARDEHGDTSSGPVWTFATGIEPDLLIYDVNLVLQGWDWVIANYGAVTLDRGTGTARVAEFRENQKDAALVLYVYDAAGSPLGGVPVVFWYSSAPELSEEWAHACGKTNGILGYTEPSGKIGFAMYTGAYYFPPAGGPHVVWVATPGTDCLGGMGMLGGTNHYHLDSNWKLPEGSALAALPDGVDLSLVR